MFMLCLSGLIDGESRKILLEGSGHYFSYIDMQMYACPQCSLCKQTLFDLKPGSGISLFHVCAAVSCLSLPIS